MKIILQMFYAICDTWINIGNTSCENLCFASVKTKAQIDCALTVQVISTFIFASHMVRSLFFQNSKLQAFSHHLRMYNPVCVKNHKGWFCRDSKYWARQRHCLYSVRAIGLFIDADCTDCENTKFNTETRCFTM